jgi:hypothetical protein
MPGAGPAGGGGKGDERARLTCACHLFASSLLLCNHSASLSSSAPGLHAIADIGSSPWDIGAPFAASALPKLRHSPGMLIAWGARLENWPGRRWRLPSPTYSLALLLQARRKDWRSRWTAVSFRC